jgi:hypothetical protein
MEYDMTAARSTYDIKGKSTQNFKRKIWREESNWKT